MVIATGLSPIFISESQPAFPGAVPSVELASPRVTNDSPGGDGDSGVRLDSAVAAAERHDVRPTQHRQVRSDILAHPVAEVVYRQRRPGISLALGF